MKAPTTLVEAVQQQAEILHSFLVSGLSAEDQKILIFHAWMKKMKNCVMLYQNYVSWSPINM